MAQIMTPQKAKLGPDNDTTACIYIYIYIQGVALRIDPKFDCWVYFALQQYSVFAGFERKKTQK